MSTKDVFQKVGIWGIIITGALIILSIIFGFFVAIYALFVYFFGNSNNVSSISSAIQTN